jgi:hypothetical protein
MGDPDNFYRPDKWNQERVVHPRSQVAIGKQVEAKSPVFRRRQPPASDKDLVVGRLVQLPRPMLVGVCKSRTRRRSSKVEMNRLAHRGGRAPTNLPKRVGRA